MCDFHSLTVSTTPHVSSDDRCIQNVFIITQMTNYDPSIWSTYLAGLLTGIQQKEAGEATVALII